MPRGFLKWWGLNSLFFLVFACADRLQDNSEKAPFDFEKKQIELGKKLFFFNGFSKDGQQNCASCHQPDSGFASSKTIFSAGILRNASSLLNLKNSPHFFWDGREKNLESLVTKPIINEDEMHGDLEQAIAKLENTAFKKEFEGVYGKDTIYTALLARALTAFVKSLESPDLEEENTEIFKKGKALFLSHCQSCHAGKIATDFVLRKSVIASSGGDSGHFRVSHLPEDVYKFKTPGLRMISKSPPYGHDGRFANLENVVFAYSQKLNAPELKEKSNRNALLHFLKSL